MSTTPTKARMIRLVLLISLPLYILDQITKWWTVMNFKLPFVVIEGQKYAVPEDTRPVIEGFFNLVRRHNQGVAFGIGNGTTWAPVVFLFVLVIALAGITYFWKKGAFTGPAKWAPPLLISGIIGNLTDRLFQGFWLEPYKDASFMERLGQGYVVDFLDFKIPGFEKIMPSSGGHWPAFNVADSCITTAAVLLFCTALLEAWKEFKEKKAKA
ncbi:signal peptidase II [Verrucomicrobiaceae bacterium 5K15]|uniref:Lipoprotein signal peptidase n=1 Tax=Oceaniferula flava TaxID=2800421 RepID=A0AAE2S9Z1_9BACT|nr:signal peptidase II [Oceaniferula flavus]MBK1853462.1 signal peptidase II [Oceaniferula flavus]MBM1134767.1 signal peptidase II [Oceaniferula flavus]